MGSPFVPSLQCDINASLAAGASIFSMPLAPCVKSDCLNTTATECGDFNASRGAGAGPPPALAGLGGLAVAPGAPGLGACPACGAGRGEAAAYVERSFALDDAKKKVGEAKEWLDEASAKGLPLQQMIAALAFDSLAIVMGFLPRDSFELFGAGGRIASDCRLSNPSWEAYLNTTRVLACLGAASIVGAWVLGSAVIGYAPCQRAKQWRPRSRRKAFLGWVVAMLVSALLLIAFQLLWSQSVLLAVLQESSGSGCEGALVYITTFWEYAQTFVVGMGVSQYTAGVCTAVKTLWNKKDELAELKMALAELRGDLSAAETRVSTAAAETAAAVHAHWQRWHGHGEVQAAEVLHVSMAPTAAAVQGDAAKALKEDTGWFHSIQPTSDLRVCADSSHEVEAARAEVCPALCGRGNGILTACGGGEKPRPPKDIRSLPHRHAHVI